MSPRATRSVTAGVADGMLRVRLAAPPHEGRANAALTAFIAGLLDTAPSNVRLVKGGASRRKMLRLRGVTIDEARRSLGL